MEHAGHRWCAHVEIDDASALGGRRRIPLLWTPKAEYVGWSGESTQDLQAGGSGCNSPMQLLLLHLSNGLS